MYRRTSRAAEHAFALSALGASLAAAAAVSYALTKRRSRAPYSSKQWTSAVAPDGAVPGFVDVAMAISVAVCGSAVNCSQGLDACLRREVWPLLLGVYSPECTAAQRHEQHAPLSAAYLQLQATCQALEDAAYAAGSGRQSAAPASPVAAAPGGEGPALAAPPTAPHQQLPQKVVQFAEAHRLIVLDAVRTDFGSPALVAIGGGGSVPGSAAHRALQPPLSDWVGSWLSGGEHMRSAAAAANGTHGGVGPDAAPAHPPASLWMSRLASKVLEQSTHLTSGCRHQAARLIALLSAYAVHDPETGYCQGMSDLAVPCVTLLDDDAVAFWCFAALMRKARRNFAVDEAGIFGQLAALSRLLQAEDGTLGHHLRRLGVAEECYFAYRMIVVLLRRDLPPPQVLGLWEMMWAEDWLGQHRKRRAQAPTPAPPSGADQSADGPSQLVQLVVKGEHTQGGSSGGGSTARGGQAPPPPVFEAASWEGPDEQGSHSLLLFFVAAVVLGQKRRVLDECYEGDDVLRLFQDVRPDFWECVERARRMRRRYGGGSSAAAARAQLAASAS